MFIAPRDGTQLPEEAGAKIVPAKWRVFVDYEDSLRVVQLPVSASYWKDWTCACVALQKKWVCHHVMGIAIRRKVVKTFFI
jgi:hypothetical protein